MSDPMRLVVVGSAGRMGRALVRLIAEDPVLTLHAALGREGSAALGRDAGDLAGSGPLGVAISSDVASALDGAHGIVDFSTPATTFALAKLAAACGLVHVIGTTGIDAGGEGAIAEAARSARIVKSGNMSLGVNLLALLVEQAARALPAGAFDIEVLEMHHRHKVDAPSGTALLLGQAAAAGRGIDLASSSVRSRDGHTGPRAAGTVGFATLRGGSVVGDHQVILAGDGERIELGHRAEDRSVFARGGLAAALWARDQAPGLYSMRDVLGL